MVIIITVAIVPYDYCISLPNAMIIIIVAIDTCNHYISRTKCNVNDFCLRSIATVQRILNLCIIFI